MFRKDELAMTNVIGDDTKKTPMTHLSLAAKATFALTYTSKLSEFNALSWKKLEQTNVQHFSLYLFSLKEHIFSWSIALLPQLFRTKMCVCCVSKLVSIIQYFKPNWDILAVKFLQWSADLFSVIAAFQTAKIWHINSHNDHDFDPIMQIVKALFSYLYSFVTAKLYKNQKELRKQYNYRWKWETISRMLTRFNSQFLLKLAT